MKKMMMSAVMAIALLASSSVMAQDVKKETKGKEKKECTKDGEKKCCSDSTKKDSKKVK